MWAYWVHNGRRWVSVGTDRVRAAFMVQLARELPVDAGLPHRGRAAVTRATAAGVCGQENVPAAPMDVHVTSATQIVVGDSQHVLSMCGEDLGEYVVAARVHPVGNYLTPSSPHMARVTCMLCRERMA